MTYKSLLQEALKLKPELIKIRRLIHSYPELGYQEIKTAKLISTTLKKLGLIVHNKVTKTGVVGILKGNKLGKTVAVRSDMDALPIHEKSKKKYRSKIPGIMHACGHDGKIAVVLGAATLLAGLRTKLVGQVKFIFQPNEEGSGGAQAMISAGVLENPKVDCMFGIDISSYIDTGKIGVRYGITAANVQDFEILISGKGGHIARPHETTDTVLVASQIIEELQLIINRCVNPVNPAIISIGEIDGGTATNVFPNCIKLRGTIRTLNNSLHKMLIGKIKRLVKNVSQNYSVKCELRFLTSYPMLINDKNLNNLLVKVIKKMFGGKGLFTWPYASLGGEDLSLFFRHVPGIIFSIGVRNKKKGIISPEHSPFFDLDEDALPFGSAIVTGCVLEYLNSNIPLSQ